MSSEPPVSKPAGTPPVNRPRLAFMDTVEAAAILKTDRLTVLKYIEEGKLKPFGGKPNNPFVRTDDVEKLSQELHLNEEATPALDPKQVHRNDPVRKLKLRIQQDAKWHEVDEAAMRAWANELDLISYERTRKVARDAIAQLQKVIEVLNETEADRKKGTS
ncbi:MAG TPA: hypothetical protein VH186_31100 [Chloroflexia bacterium]|nr:hypothetical protein [Chloroflexia bacterium]